MPRIYGSTLLFHDKDRLDRWHPATRAVLALGYRFKDKSDDPWTARMNGFKANEPKAVMGAIRTVPEVLSGLQWGDEGRIVTCAISSAETQSRTGSAIFRTAKAIATRFGWDFEPHLLRKAVHQSLHTIHGAAARDSTVAGKYSVTAPVRKRRVLIVDDLTTRGSTIHEIARALSAVRDDVIVSGFVLGKSEGFYYNSARGMTLTNGHIPAVYAQSWDADNG